jgi:Skp family chaperone for outer membrane proteins
MNRASAAIALLCSAFLAQAAVAQDPAADKGSPQAAAKLAIGYVDFVKVFEAYPRVAEDRKQLGELKKQRTARLTEEEAQLKKLQMQAELENKGTARRAEKDLEIQGLGRRIEALQEIYQTEIRMALEEMQVAWFEDAQRAIAIVAKERGLAMVFRVFGENGDTVRDKAVVLEKRAVWYASEEVDITSSVIKVLQVPLPPVKPESKPAPKEASASKTTDGKSQDSK